MTYEDHIKLEARLYALERSVCVLLAAIYQQAGKHGPEILEMTHQRTIENARNLTFPNVDPAFSDMFASEIGVAADRLLVMQKQLLGIA